jgi:tRNA uridine 5-carboxymethylaminomethyl modification enzyme
MESLMTDGRYAGYLAKERAALQQMQDLDGWAIPEGTDYDAVLHLRHEAKEKLSRIRPGNLGQALRISGITPADVTILAIYLTGRGKS